MIHLECAIRIPTYYCYVTDYEYLWLSASLNINTKTNTKHFIITSTEQLTSCPCTYSLSDTINTARVNHKYKLATFTCMYTVVYHNNDLRIAINNVIGKLIRIRYG